MHVRCRHKGLGLRLGTKVPKDLTNGIQARVSPTSPLRLQSSLAALTGLRFIAAFDVVLYHFAHIPLPAWATPAKNIIGSGFVGVSLFFILSGFIMAYTYLAPDGGLRGTSRNFYASRFARIFPAYLLGFVLAAPTDIFLSLRANPVAIASLKLAVNGILVLAFVQAWTPYTAWAWNFPAWSVSVEVFFYALFPWLGPRLSRIPLSRCLVVAAGLWIVSLVAPTALFLLKGPTGPPQIGDYLQMAVEFTPLLRVPEFAIGILVGRVFVAGGFDRLRNGLLSLIVALIILMVMAFSPHLSHPFLAGGLLTPLFVLLIVTLAGGNGPLASFLSMPFMILLGEASYGIYILQIPVSYVLRCPPPHTSGRVLLTYCGALVFVALLSFRFIESPLRLRIRRWLGGPEPSIVRSNASANSLVWAQGPVDPAVATIGSTDQAKGPARKTTRRSVVVGISAAAGASAVYGAVRFMRGARSQPGRRCLYLLRNLSG